VVPHLHPFLSALRPDSAAGTVTLQCRISSRARLANLLDHVVMGRVLLPAAAMMELAAATAATLLQDSAHEAGQLLAITAMAISAPIILQSPAPAAARGGNDDALELLCSLELSTGRLSIGYAYSSSSSSSAAMVTCATATAGVVDAAAVHEPQQLQASAAAVLANIMSVHAAAGHKTAGLGAVGTIKSVADDWRTSGYFSSPAQVDAALHLGVVPQGSGAKVPVAVGSFVVPRAAASRASATGQLHASTVSGSPASAPGGTSSSSFLLRSAAGIAAGASSRPRVAGRSSMLGADAGDLVVVIDDLQTRVVRAGDVSRMQQPQCVATAPLAASAADKASAAGDADADEPYPCSYELQWQSKEPASAATVAAPDSRQAGKLSLLIHQEQEATSVTLQLAARGSTAGTAAAAASALAVLQQVNQAAAGSMPQALSLQAQMPGGSSALGPSAGLQGTASAGGDSISAVWGLLRTQATEQGSIAVSLVEADSCAAQSEREPAQPASSSTTGALAALAVRGSGLQVPRLLPCASPESAQFISITPEPRSSLANLVARAADVSKVRRDH
jgi:hypothetical protein